MLSVLESLTKTSGDATSQSTFIVMTFLYSYMHRNFSSPQDQHVVHAVISMLHFIILSYLISLVYSTKAALLTHQAWIIFTNTTKR